MKPKKPKARVMYCRPDSLAKIYDEAMLHCRTTHGTFKQPVAVLPSATKKQAQQIVRFFNKEERVEEMAKEVLLHVGPKNGSAAYIAACARGCARAIHALIFGGTGK